VVVATVRELPGIPAAVADARALVDEFLRGLPRMAPTAHWLKLIVSELATNAVVHTGAAFSVALRETATGVRGEVSDDDEALPLLDEGRGLHIVDLLCDRWGWVPRRDGKLVWFELDFSAD
jgi:anti-sigma regulatory factor (Ser/Thr protein kinase)